MAKIKVSVIENNINSKGYHNVKIELKCFNDDNLLPSADIFTKNTVNIKCWSSNIMYLYFENVSFSQIKKALSGIIQEIKKQLEEWLIEKAKIEKTIKKVAKLKGEIEL